MSRLTRDGTAEPISQNRILRRERGQRNIYFLCSAEHEQDWRPYPIDPYAESPPDTGPVNLKVVPNECCLGRSPWTN